MKQIKFGLLMLPAALTIAAIPAIAQQSQVYTYECDTGGSFRAQYGANSATVTFNNGQTVTLPAVPASEVPLSPGQARYSDGTYLLFTTSNNNEAFVELNGDRTQEGCIAQPTARSSPTTSPTPVPALW